MSWLTSSGLDVLAQLRNAPLEVSGTFSEIEASLKTDALQTLTARATGKEAAWCQNFPTLLQGDEWNVQTNYAGELAGLREFVTVVTGSAPLPQAQALSPMTSPSYAEVIAAGIDPKNQFIPDEFHCYDESGADYSRPHMVVQITGPGQYKSSYGGGTFVLEADDSYAPDITWTSGPLTDAGGSLYFNDYGQTFSPYVSFGDTSVSYGCYQQGASEGRALTVFRSERPAGGHLPVSGRRDRADATLGIATRLCLHPGGTKGNVRRDRFAGGRRRQFANKLAHRPFGGG